MVNLIVLLLNIMGQDMVFISRGNVINADSQIVMMPSFFFNDIWRHHLINLMLPYHHICTILVSFQFAFKIKHLNIHNLHSFSLLLNPPSCQKASLSNSAVKFFCSIIRNWMGDGVELPFFVLHGLRKKRSYL